MLENRELIIVDLACAVNEVLWPIFAQKGEPRRRGCLKGITFISPFDVGRPCLGDRFCTSLTIVCLNPVLFTSVILLDNDAKDFFCHAWRNYASTTY